MPTTTANTHLRVPVAADANNVPADMLNLANDVDGALSAQGLLSARPAAGNRGKRYFATDVPAHYYDDGAAWQPISGGDAPLRAYSEKVVTLSGTGTLTVDLSAGTVFDITASGGNVTLQVINPVAAGRASSALLILRQDATGGRTWTFPSSFKWPSGAAPATSTGASKVDTVAIVTDNGGTTYLAALSAADHR